MRPSKSHGSGGAAELVEPGLSAGADRRSRLHPADDAGPIESPPPSVRDLDVLDQSGNRLGTINFEAERDAPTGQRPTSAQQAQFGEDFRRELSQLERWAAANDWRPSRIRELHVVVSDRYRISRSLVPAWYGHAGHMEFPAWRVLAGNAAIAHELVHVFFPNGNRFLAEGLAVHLQAAIGGNRAFPNFGRPLHVMARELLRERLPGFAHRHLEALRLADLDRIMAPSPLDAPGRSGFPRRGAAWAGLPLFDRRFVRSIPDRSARDREVSGALRDDAAGAEAAGRRIAGPLERRL